MKKIIIAASERSGTNLLRTLLGNHKDLSAPIALHVFDSFYGHIDKYGDLDKESSAVKLMNHLLRLANHEYNDWTLQVDSEALVSGYKVNSLVKAFNAIYSEKAKQEGCSGYVCKDNHMWNYADQMEVLEQVHWIYLYRDPRDHVASWLRTPLRMHTAYDISLKWEAEQEAIFGLGDQVTLHKVSYEELIESTDQVMSNLLNDLGLQVDPNCFETDPKNVESTRNEFWKNLSKPILRNNSKKYRNSLSRKDIRIVESVCRKSMTQLSYEFDTDASWKFKKYGLDDWAFRIKRIVSRRKHRELFLVTMKDLNDKLHLIRGFRNELM